MAHFWILIGQICDPSSKSPSVLERYFILLIIFPIGIAYSVVIILSDICNKGHPEHHYGIFEASLNFPLEKVRH